MSNSECGNTDPDHIALHKKLEEEPVKRDWTEEGVRRISTERLQDEWLAAERYSNETYELSEIDRATDRQLLIERELKRRDA